MDAADKGEEIKLISKDGIPRALTDRRLPYEKKRAVNIILLSTLFERIAFYAFVNTLFTTLQSEELFDWNGQHSKTASYIFSGIGYSSTFFFAVISDWKLGRAKTITIGFILYLIGLTIITITASGNTFLCHYNETEQRNATSIANEKCAPTILGTLIFTALGVGAIKSNLVVLGAEQNQDQESRQFSRYFEKYAFVVNFGSMIGIAFIPYFQHILPRHHLYILYVAAMGMLLIAFLLFCIGWRYYLHDSSNETLIFRIIPMMINACRSWFAYKRARRSRNRSRTKATDTALIQLNRASSPDEFEDSMTVREKLPSLLDFARRPYGGAFHDRLVDDVKAFRRAVFVFALLIPFWLVYNQVGATFQSQGKHMRGSTPSYIITWISLGDPIIVTTGILVLNGLVYKYFDARHEPLSITKKLVLGMFFAFASMCTAGIVEFARHKQCDNVTGNSRLSIYAQLPQSFLIGFSQLFGLVGGYEYAFFSAPRHAQSLFMSLSFCSIGMSFLIGTIYFNVFPKPDVYIDFECKKDNEQWYWSFHTYFFIIAVLQLIFMVIFIVCFIKFNIVKLNRQQLEDSHGRRRSSAFSNS